MKIFIAIEMEPKVAQSISRFAKNELSEIEFRLVPRSLYHVTLRFLGEVPESRLPAIQESLLRVAQTTRSFEIEFSGTGFFPASEKPEVIWVGVQDSSQALMELVSKIETEMNTLGFESEKREYVPHVTIARKSSGSTLRWKPKSASVPFGKTTVKELVLYESRPSPGGVDYFELERIPFN